MRPCGSPRNCPSRGSEIPPLTPLSTARRRHAINSAEHWLLALRDMESEIHRIAKAIEGVDDGGSYWLHGTAMSLHEAKACLVKAKFELEENS